MCYDDQKKNIIKYFNDNKFFYSLVKTDFIFLLI